ncbi:MAG: dTDP-4-dehydrorhamnose reductase [Acidobacteria bacterium]|nr:dTDP-4-dehydrorhamnose reductase [Acidobacteriota bacterium]MCG3192605.1 dTDP-4-dehydrorhamnose reductase [Thermoanaerobaculia bacterium]
MTPHRGGEDVVVLGATGMLGTALRHEFPAAARFSRDDLDIRDGRALSSVIRPGVALVVNAAADTRVDLAETSEEHWATNAEAPGRLGELCKSSGALLVHLSTDYVFNGRSSVPYREEDPVDPVNAYGAGKLEGERRVFASGARALIVRTSWVFGLCGSNFVDTILNLAAEGRRELRVVDDQHGRATYARDLARAIRLLVEKDATGIVHFANAGPLTWFSLAREAVLLAGLTCPVVPCSSSEFPRPARRPAFSVLDTSRYEKITGEPAPLLPAALKRYIAERVAPPC